jgi:hypothetical protein
MVGGVEAHEVSSSSHTPSLNLRGCYNVRHHAQLIHSLLHLQILFETKRTVVIHAQSLTATGSVQVNAHKKNVADLPIYTATSADLKPYMRTHKLCAVSTQSGYTGV